VLRREKKRKSRDSVAGGGGAILELVLTGAVVGYSTKKRVKHGSRRE